MIGSRLSKDTTNKSFGAEDWARPSKDFLPDIEGSLNSNESVDNHDLNPTGRRANGMVSLMRLRIYNYLYIKSLKNWFPGGWKDSIPKQC